MANSHRFFYGWIVVAVAVLATLVAAGIRSAPGALLVPLEQDLGWSKTTLSLAVSIGLVLFGLGGPFSGYLMDRYGPRRITLFGLLLMGLSMAGSALMTQVWQLHLIWGVVSGVGTGIVGSVLGATVANRWFIRQRGLVTGIFGGATSAGQLIFIPALVAWATGLGWREASWIMAGIALAVMLPIFLLMKDSPAEIGERPLGAAAESASAKITADAGIMGQAVRSSTFWLLAGTFFICGATSNGLIGVHFIPYAVDCGISQGMASGMLALLGAMNFVGTIASGWLTDRYDPRKLLCVYYAFRGFSLLLLPYAVTPETMVPFAILFGLDYIATVPPTVALVADNFGRQNVGTVYGWVFAAHQLGAAFAAWAGGSVRDALGEYNLAFFAAGALAIMGGMLSLGIRRALRAAAA
ncbi:MULTISPECIES: MFS transporter [unclassified Meiothermus]|uniref:MFS transporter n=1 Tax=unclassified Meiothermus TaxID=370471 RepID=UPI000D7BA436|nr:MULTISPECIES: MFS transporter [unclassified Meiothermus]PZA08557.1 MFS transporter [Meiothermus sp. Pnk-1]RYM40825.1 MFS transporter [Meiothermus sp. PNK-Is4]